MRDILEPKECPKCGTVLLDEGRLPIVKALDVQKCIRKCLKCNVGFSNGKDATIIYGNRLDNIPVLLQGQLRETAFSSLNIRSRFSKWRRLGYSTSEDAISWVIFRYLQTLDQIKLSNQKIHKPNIWFWGVPSPDNSLVGIPIRKHLEAISDELGEMQVSRSEPDIIVWDNSNQHLYFIEAKYRSPNDSKPVDYPGWSNRGYLDVPSAFHDKQQAQNSGRYELCRNWSIGVKLRERLGSKRFALINLVRTPETGKSKQQLDSFVMSLNTSYGDFAILTWQELLKNQKLAKWFSNWLTADGRTGLIA